MSKLVLFSPLGMTDIIRDCYDGPMLHIARVYKPDIIYLYMTKEILDLHNKDNKYVEVINLLSEKIGKKIKVEIYKDPEMINPEKFNAFYDKFKNYLNDIESKNDDIEIILNVSSGTPAIKSTLEAIASLSKGKYKAIQVTSPKNAANLDAKHETSTFYKDLWDNDLDNEDDFNNRCETLKENYLVSLILKENIKMMIDEYDYASANFLVNHNDICNQKAIRLIKAGKARSELDFSIIDKNIDIKEKNYFYATQNGKDKKIVEYILILKLRIDKNLFIDFIRGITPLVTDLYERYFEENRIDINEFTINDYKNNINRKFLSVEKIMEKNIDLYKYLESIMPHYKSGPLSTKNMNDIVGYYCEIGKCNKREYSVMVDIRDKVEATVRNLAAHEIVKVTDEDIKERTTFTSKQIFDKLVLFAQYVGINITHEMLKSYTKMNEYIKQYID